MDSQELYEAYDRMTAHQHPCDECGDLFVVHQPGTHDHDWTPGSMTDDYFPPGHPARTDS